MLFTKSVYDARSRDDGFRVCVMSRLTEDDGVTPVPLLCAGKSFDAWLPILGPPGRLVGAWYRGEISWGEFERQYQEYVLQENVVPLVKLIAEQARERDISLLCVEPLGEHCHRLTLAECCRGYVPKLEVVHR